MSKNDKNTNAELNSESDMIFYGGEFAGNIAVKTLIKDNLLQSYNLVGGDKDESNEGIGALNVSSLFNGLAIPSCLLHMPKIGGSYNDNIESEEEDNDDDYEMSVRHERNKPSYYGGKKSPENNKKGRTIMTHNNPEAGVVSEGLYDKFLQMAQDLNMYKNRRKTKKQIIAKTNKHNKQTKKIKI